MGEARAAGSSEPLGNGRPRIHGDQRASWLLAPPPRLPKAQPIRGERSCQSARRRHDRDGGCRCQPPGFPPVGSFLYSPSSRAQLPQKSVERWTPSAFKRRGQRTGALPARPREHRQRLWLKAGGEAGQRERGGDGPSQLARLRECGAGAPRGLGVTNRRSNGHRLAPSLRRPAAILGRETLLCPRLPRARFSIYRERAWLLRPQGHCCGRRQPSWGGKRSPPQKPLRAALSPPPGHFGKGHAPAPRNVA